ncbi:hypothetical protein TNCV_85281 [Trichonephila clavipes]|nr:hypothetical protein TNCV_85281 [Trichonephila clavipes]
MLVGALETFKDVMEKGDARIVFLRKFRLEHKVAATVVNVNKTWDVGTTSKQTVRSGNMKIDLEPIFQCNNLPTFGDNVQSENAQSKSTTCPNGGAKSTTSGDL